MDLRVASSRHKFQLAAAISTLALTLVLPMKLLMTCTRMGVVVASPQSALQHDYVCVKDGYSAADVSCSALVQRAVLASSIH
jgi:hypothetical protein